MMGMTTGPGAGTADRLDRLLAVLSDPTTTRKAIADIRTAERAAEQRIAEANKREAVIKAANDQRTAGLDAKFTLLIAREDQAGSKDRQLTARAQELDGRAGSLAEAEIDQTSREANLTAREIKVGQRAVGLDTQEADLAQREQATATAAEDAEAMRSDYEARIERLKRSLAGT